MLRRGKLIQAFALLFLALTVLVRADEPEFPPLTTAEGNSRLPGKFIWADLVTDDVAKAREFYAQVFGWQFWGMGNYFIAMFKDTALVAIISVEELMFTAEQLGATTYKYLEIFTATFLIYLAVSATNQCNYCMASHTASARKQGMTVEMLGELMAVVGLANNTNALAAGYQVQIDEQFR